MDEKELKETKIKYLPLGKIQLLGGSGRGSFREGRTLLSHRGCYPVSLLGLAVLFKETGGAQVPSEERWPRAPQRRSIWQVRKRRLSRSQEGAEASRQIQT
ncbi:hypothetical protein AAY473_012799 [Plecturocebus cupreus]